MKRLTLFAMLALGSSFATVAGAADDTEPINTLCPVGKEAIVASAGTVEHDGHAIGLCCPACGKAFLAWEESRRDAFVALVLRDEESGQAKRGSQEKPAASQPVKAVSMPYPLDTCVVSGSKLGSMGDPIVKKYDGREVRFCCGGCIGKFEADQTGYFKKIDALIVKDQLRYYPTSTCVVTGEPLVEDGKDIATSIVYQNRLVRLCCKGCVRKFNEDAPRYIANLDKLTADAQRKNYPSDNCVVAGGPLGSMGEPTEMVVAGRLLRFCCAGCEPKVKADPVKYLTAIDKAWQAKGKYKAEKTKGSREGRGHEGHDQGSGG